MRFVAGRGRRARAVAGRGAVAERHQEDTAGRGRRARAVAGRGAVTELLLAGAQWRRAIGKMLLAGVPCMEENAAASGSSCGGLPFKVALMVFCPLFGKEAPSGDELWN